MNASFLISLIHLQFHGSTIQISIKNLRLIASLILFPILKIHKTLLILVILILMVLYLPLHNPLYIDTQELSLCQINWKIMSAIILHISHHNLSTHLFPTLLHIFIHLIIYHHHINHFYFCHKKYRA